MRRVVLDASALLSWFSREPSGRALRAEYEQGLLGVVAPHQLTADVLSSLAGSPKERLLRVAAELDRLGFELREPPIDELASWLAQGLSAGQAGYAALASSLDLPLITADADLLRSARTVARPVADG